MGTALTNARRGDALYTIFAKDGKITAVTPVGSAAEKMAFATHAPRHIRDLGGKKLYPGLIDIHSHGCIGYDTMDGDHLPEMAAEYRRRGVTTWYPTTMTESPERIHAALTQTLPAPGEGCHIGGYHVEGPYINKKYKGAQNGDYIVPPDLATFSRYPQAKLVTVAPECEGAIEFIRGTEACVALGHTAADYETSVAALRAGAKCLTHTCNAMPPFHHRNPGPIGAAIDEGGYAQVIADGLHLARSMVTMLYRTFGPGRMILISDSMQATGLGDGCYIFGGQNVTVKDGVARTDDGALAGSTTTLFDCVRTAISFGIPEEDAFRMASETPAEMLGTPNGRIAVGYDADFIVVDDDLRLVETIML